MTVFLVGKDPPIQSGSSGSGPTSRARTNRPAWFARAVFALDGCLRRQQHVIEYTAHPDCIFRMRVVHSDRPLSLRDGTSIKLHGRLVELHLWNEQIPTFPAEGASIAWARKMSRMLALSLGQLAAHLESRPDLADVKAIRAELALAAAGQDEQLARMAERFGFERCPHAAPARPIPGRLRRIGENLLISLLVLARNPHALRAETLVRSRVEIFLSRDRLCKAFPCPERSSS